MFVGVYDGDVIFEIPVVFLYPIVWVRVNACSMAKVLELARKILV